MNPEEFRAAGHAVIDFLADYHASLSQRPVMAQTRPGEVRAQLPGAAPTEPESFARVLSDVEQVVLPGLSLWQHPRFFGYFPANADLGSVLGDMLSTGLGVLGLSWQSSPALTEVEEVVTDWMRQLVGLPDTFHGVIQDTASTSTLVALLCARERTTAYSASRAGLQGEARPLVVYTSVYSHSSVQKAAVLAGFGNDNVRAIPADEAFALRPDLLEAAILSDLEAGRVPCAVVVSTGTTTTTALDPVAAVAVLTERHGLWLHVDAAMAGTAMMLPECRWMWNGVERADSVVLNPHKWLGSVFDNSLYYVRDPQHLVRVMSTNPSYLQSAADGEVTNYRDWGIPLGRRFRALKLWSMLRTSGIEAIQARLRRDLANAQWLAEQVRAAPDWQVLAPVPLQTVCVRYAPAGLTAEALDHLTQAWCARINDSGEAYLTPATLEGRWMVRVSIGALTTERTHVEQLWEIMQRHAAEVAQSMAAGV
ncbi:pyridoxal phosphate-dependent decarboxylase family protein [Deinococcus hohokamensis]|uniref:Pyridoxal phosphate-dependent decarboxylase family protein n=1 Tax=Deinococcus hohokamensis TaxID=309883 RepID=A0ABV9ID33_9DEIO